MVVAPGAVVVDPLALVVVAPFTVVVVAPFVVVVGRGGRGVRHELRDHPELQLGGLADERQGLRAVLRARQVDHDRVALAVDLGLGDTEGVDPVGDDLDRGVQGREIGALHREQHDRDPALQVETELRAAVAEQRREEREEDQHDGDGEKPDLTAHSRSVGRFVG